MFISPLLVKNWPMAIQNPLLKGSNKFQFELIYLNSKQFTERKKPEKCFFFLHMITDVPFKKIMKGC